MCSKKVIHLIRVNSKKLGRITPECRLAPAPSLLRGPSALRNMLTPPQKQAYSLVLTGHGVDRGGGVHNMLRVRVCAAHMGGFLGPKFSKQGSLFRQIFHKQGWVIQKLAKNSKKRVIFRQNSS